MVIIKLMIRFGGFFLVKNDKVSFFGRGFNFLSLFFVLNEIVFSI